MSFVILGTEVVPTLSFVILGTEAVPTLSVLSVKLGKEAVSSLSVFGPSVADQVVSLSDDGTTIIIDSLLSFLVRACACAIGVFQTRWYHYNH
jgi:hypothetical protein